MFDGFDSFDSFAFHLNKSVFSMEVLFYCQDISCYHNMPLEFLICLPEDGSVLCLHPTW